MRALRALTAANLRSFIRDRAALFWTLAFPVVFVILFGTIFSGRQLRLHARLGRPGRDAARRRPPRGVHRERPGRAGRRDARGGAGAKMLAGDLDGIIVIPKGLADAIAAGQAGQAWRPGRDHRHHGSEPIDHVAGGPADRDGPRDGREPLSCPARRPLLTVAAESLQTRLAQRRLVLRAEHPRHGPDAARNLRRDPAGPAAGEAHPQAAQRDAAAAVGPRRLERPRAAAHRRGADRDHPGHRDRRAGGRDHRQPAGHRRLRRARGADVHLDRLCDRLVRADRGGRERDDEHRPVPADVPLRDLLPARGHAGVAPRGRDVPAAHLPRRCAAPDDGRRDAVRADSASMPSCSSAGWS